MRSHLKVLSEILTKALRTSVPEFEKEVVVVQPHFKQFHYCSPSAMNLFNRYRKTGCFGNPTCEALAQKIISAVDLEANPVIGNLVLQPVGVPEKKEKPECKPKESDGKEETKQENKEDKKKKKGAKKQSEPGYFINIALKKEFVEAQIKALFELKKGKFIHEVENEGIKVAVDFSSPNIAKEMHVGHLRSTIIGEAACRMLEMQGFTVDRINHVGDWGTQFGMLIAQLKQDHPNFLEQKPDLGDLQNFYVKSKKSFDESEEFKELARKTVVKLQSYDPETIKAWELFCQLSREQFEKVYKRLDVTVHERGESFYNKMIPGIIEDLEKQGHIEEDQGCKVVKLPGFKTPLIAVKSDGGYNYDSTDIAAIHHRIFDLKCHRLIYITDSGQEYHFKQIFAAAEKAGWKKGPLPRLDHMNFGLVLKKGGSKISTRAGETPKLMDLLTEAKDRAKAQLEARFEAQGGQKAIPPEQLGLDDNEQEKEGKDFQTTGTYLKAEEIENYAQKIGMAAVKYYDLKQNRISTYAFDYDKMLDPKGNTAVYLMYAYARICSIMRKAGVSQKQDQITSQEQIEALIKETKLDFSDEHELDLASYLLRFPDQVALASDQLKINALCELLYEISGKLAEFYQACNVLKSEQKNSRLLLIEATRRVMGELFYLVGITPIDRI